MTDQSVTREQIESVLARVLASPALGEGERLRSMLSFLVSEELAGRGDRLKAYTVATGALGRDDDFDPGRDNIVRVEANRLRQALRNYALADGLDDSIQIEIPKGGYRPRFTPRSPAERPKSVNPRLRGPLLMATLVMAFLGVGVGWWWSQKEPVPRPATFEGPRILIGQFEPVGLDALNERLAVGLVAELVSGLSQYHWLSVALWPGDQNALVSAVAEANTVAPDYLLSGETLLDEQTWRVTTRLQSLPDLTVIWTGNREVPLAAHVIEEVEQSIARDITDRVGSERGIVPMLLAADTSPLDTVAFHAFDCVLSIHTYWREPSSAGHLALRNCLEQVTDAFPVYAEAWAALVYVYIDEERHGRNPRIGADSWADATQAAANALAAAPLSSMVLNAAMTLAIERPDRDLKAFRRYGELELDLRPNNPFTLANYGMKLAINAGDFATGPGLVERAIHLAYDPPAWYFYTRAYAALLAADDAQLTDAARHLYAEQSPASLILKAIASARGGENDALYDELEKLDQLNITDVQEASTYIANRRFAPALEKTMLDAVAEAFGLGKR